MYQMINNYIKFIKPFSLTDTELLAIYTLSHFILKMTIGDKHYILI